MIPRIESGISGLDDLLLDEKTGFKGIPENTATLVYGPPKSGKSIFCYQFMYHGLLRDEPCLCLLTDYGIKQLQEGMMDFDWNLQTYTQNQMVYIIDAISSVSGSRIVETETYASSSVSNPTDIMVKLGSGTRFISKKSQRFRSIIDSLTTLFAFNQEMLIVRVLKAYIMRVKEAGGTILVTYTEGSSDTKIETILKATADNIVRLDGENLSIEAMIGGGRRSAPYRITDKGIIVGKE